jgi:hypothetical protein
MLRYHCPQCNQLLQAHELRAGKKSVCISCLSTHIIPVDRSAWLSAGGEPLLARQSSVEPIEQAIASVSQTILSSVDHISETAVPGNANNEAASHQEQTIHSTTSEPEEPLIESRPAIPNRSTFAVDYPIHPATAPVSHLTTKTPAKLEPVDSGKLSANIALSEPVHVQTQAEIAAALTEVLSHRMKPPRNPRRDLRLSTAGWLGLTGLGVAMLLVSLFTSADYVHAVIVVGIVEIAIGYGWIIWLTAHRDPKRGIVCAVPPLTFYFLGQWKYAKFRPLRFVASGIVLAGLALLCSSVNSTTRGWAKGNSHNTSSTPVDPEKMSKLEKVRDYKKQRAYDKLIDLLRDLTKTDAQKSVDAQDGPELAIELKDLCYHPDTGVKVAAMAAYARWGGEDAREICLDATKSSSQEERMMAIQLLPQWKNTTEAQQVASAIASLIGRPGLESTRAEAALVEVGGVVAERAALGLLLRSEDQTTRFMVLSILDKVGGNESITSLRSYADTCLDQDVKSKALDTIEIIKKRKK